MGLSEHEQQVLDDMERRLYQSEADVMQAGSGAPRRINLRSLVLGILVGLAGLGVLIGGVAAQQLWLGLIGFVAMLGGTVLAFTRADGGDAVEVGGSTAPKQTGPTRESLSERMERRWDQRMNDEM